MSPSLFVLIPALACAIFALIFLAGARHCRMRRAALGAGLRLLLALGFALAAIGLIGLGVTIRHYLALEGEVTVARLDFRELAPNRFEVRVTTADGREQLFELTGEEWQLDARVISWKLPAALAGAPPLYRVERLSGRYRDIARERESARSVHALDAGALPDLWVLKGRFPRWLPFVDAHYGSAAYLPMGDGARYTVTLGGRGGLVARPADAATQRRMEESGW